MKHLCRSCSREFNTKKERERHVAKELRQQHCKHKYIIEKFRDGIARYLMCGICEKNWVEATPFIKNTIRLTL